MQILESGFDFGQSLFMWTLLIPVWIKYVTDWLTMQPKWLVNKVYMVFDYVRFWITACLFSSKRLENFEINQISQLKILKIY